VSEASGMGGGERARLVTRVRANGTGGRIPRRELRSRAAPGSLSYRKARRYRNYRALAPILPDFRVRWLISAMWFKGSLTGCAASLSSYGARPGVAAFAEKGKLAQR